MSSTDLIKILFVNTSEREAKLLREYLDKFETAKFQVVWQESGEHALEYLKQNKEVDIIVTDDALSGMNGIEFTRKLKEFSYTQPVVFLTSTKDVNLAVEVMRMGVKDYLLKEDIGSRVFPQSLLKIVEKQKLKHEFSELENKKRRLEIMQEIVIDISQKISEPLAEMDKITKLLDKLNPPEKAAKYLKLIKENIERMQAKLEKLQNLKEDKTVKYIRDIKMIDLS